MTCKPHRTIYCCACLQDVEAVHATGTTIYPHRPDLKHKQFYQCPTCRNYVGCHPRTGKEWSDEPLGNIPTPELRQARGHIHAILDPIWKRKKMRRGDIYARLTAKIGRQYHTAEIRTVEEAREVYRLVQEIAREVAA